MVPNVMKAKNLKVIKNTKTKEIDKRGMRSDVTNPQTQEHKKYKDAYDNKKSSKYMGV